ncbi:hypothetical protein AG0111_0g11640 [Alternaria gaisen]|uniref:Uncharacterized protein n=1 Tax=Alternaria gaisen TaxID=167740 RepID=A0ACB6F6Y0_9PLEO|nr:hypothetical protein AG0111_0g11640 [Alternaria gaisen]
MTADGRPNFAIEMADKISLLIQRGQQMMLDLKSSLPDLQDQNNNNEMMTDAAHEGLAAIKDRFDEMCNHLEKLLDFYGSAIKSLCQTITTVASPYLGEDSIQQRCTKMKEEWRNIRSNKGYSSLEEYDFTWDVEAAVYRLIEPAPVGCLSTTALELLHCYGGFSSNVAPFTESDPGVYVQCVGSVFLSTLRWLLCEPWDTPQQTPNRGSGESDHTKSPVQKCLQTVFVHPCKKGNGYNDPICLSDDDDKEESTGSSIQKANDHLDPEAGKACRSVPSQAQVGTSHLVHAATGSTRETEPSPLNQGGPSRPHLNKRPSSLGRGSKRSRRPSGAEMAEERHLRPRRTGSKPYNDRCSCHARADSKCATESSCSFRALQTECSSACGSECKNQRISRGEFTDPESLVVRSTGEKGNGLFTVQDITRDQLVIEYTGDRLPLGSQLADNEDKRYLFQCGDVLINGNKQGNESRYLNHSCQPNLESQLWTVNGEKRVVFVSTKDIEKGTELTFSYNRAGEEKCSCQAKKCSGSLRGWQAAEKRR